MQLPVTATTWPLEALVPPTHIFHPTASLSFRSFSSVLSSLVSGDQRCARSIWSVLYGRLLQILSSEVYCRGPAPAVLHLCIRLITDIRGIKSISLELFREEEFVLLTSNTYIYMPLYLKILFGFSAKRTVAGQQNCQLLASTYQHRLLSISLKNTRRMSWCN